MGTQSEQIEQQARRVRARTSETVQALRARLTPGHLTDQVADYALEGPAAEFVRNLGREVRENPLPLVLIAIGVAWLIIASNRSYRIRVVSNIAERPAAEARNEEVLASSVVDEAASLEQTDKVAVRVVSPVDGQKMREASLRVSTVMEPSHEA